MAIYRKDEQESQIIIISYGNVIPSVQTELLGALKDNYTVF